MEMISVSSSNLAAIGYDLDSATLRVQFNHGGMYDYHSVPLDLFEGLRDASSKGTFHNEYIKKGGFSFTRLG